MKHHDILLSPQAGKHLLHPICCGVGDRSTDVRPNPKHVNGVSWHDVLANRQNTLLIESGAIGDVNHLETVDGVG